ncbi:acyl-CoA dehydrogenase family protein [Acidovorax sp. SUPP3334]|uniref:acyl-CoA dehydrogenase family protein n=1 Tax=Acidovorax sp. SUPP3334 TaxID=2920881 RepID=UPI0023DE5549|nr:acyl-CoA dehydrogenase family protein [Acidovorax sp. SUPP3334]GKT22376.1 hypothetical protein AVHM3334_08215 [Acidovorax sp. SUPP3334]
MRRDSIPELGSPAGAAARRALEQVHAFQSDPSPPSSSTAARFRWLARVAGDDVVVGKLFESHLDALGIAQEILGASEAAALRQAVDPLEGLWGLWASEGPAGAGLQLTAEADGRLTTVTGRKSWCSGAGGASAALVTVRGADGGARLVAVSMRHPGVTVTREGWEAVGMADTASVDVLFDAVPAWALAQPLRQRALQCIAVDAGLLRTKARALQAFQSQIQPDGKVACCSPRPCAPGAAAANG